MKIKQMYYLVTYFFLVKATKISSHYWNPELQYYKLSYQITTLLKDKIECNFTLLLRACIHTKKLPNEFFTVVVVYQSKFLSQPGEIIINLRCECRFRLVVLCSNLICWPHSMGTPLVHCFFAVGPMLANILKSIIIFIIKNCISLWLPLIAQWELTSSLTSVPVTLCCPDPDPYLTSWECRRILWCTFWSFKTDPHVTWVKKVVFQIKWNKIVIW